MSEMDGNPNWRNAGTKVRVKESNGNKLPKVSWPCWTGPEVQDQKAMQRTFRLCLGPQLLHPGSLLGMSHQPRSPPWGWSWAPHPAHPAGASHATPAPSSMHPSGYPCPSQASLYLLCHVFTLLFSVIYKTHAAHEFVFLIPVRSFRIQFVWKSEYNIMLYCMIKDSKNTNSISCLSETQTPVPHLKATDFLMNVSF